MSLTEGIVIRAVRGVYTVQADGSLVHCALRGNLKKHFEYSKSESRPTRVTSARRPLTHDTISIGDRVRFAETLRGAGVIEEILPRQTRFGRSGFRGREQTLISNLDQVVIVFACAEPRLDPWKLDRFLVAAESEEISAVIVANKLDLVKESEFRDQFDAFTSLGYRVVPTAAKRGDGVSLVRDLLKGRVSAVVGPSGAGKSSLLNAIQPGLNLKTSDIGYVTFKGRHTTTSAQLLPLSFGGWVADTPGLRNFDLLGVDREDLIHCFPEMREFDGGCRFDDCRHSAEPGCAIKSAVESGAIQRRRYESYAALAEEAK